MSEPFAVIVYGLWAFYAAFYIWAVCFAIDDLIRRARVRVTDDLRSLTDA